MYGRVSGNIEAKRINVINASINTCNSSARSDHSVTGFIHSTLTMKKILPTVARQDHIMAARKVESVLILSSPRMSLAAVEGKTFD